MKGINDIQMDVRETIKAIVTYSGDITPKLKACGTRTPYRINPDGNTEQEIECFRGSAANMMPHKELTAQIEPIILNDCQKNGIVLDFRWVISEEPLRFTTKTSC